jgi:hypothetical protein
MQRPQGDGQEHALAFSSIQIGSAAMMLPDEKEWEWLENAAARLIKTGMLPKHIDTPAKAVLVLLKGREVGIPPIMSLSEVFVTNGKAGMTTMAYGYLMTKAGIKVDFPLHTTTKAVCRLTRRDGRYFEQTFTMEDAARMFTGDGKGGSIRLSESHQYRSNPEEMLMNRAESRAAKRFCPDVVGGAGLMEELQDVETIDSTATTFPPQASGPDLGATLQSRIAGTAPTPPVTAGAAPAAPEPAPAAAPAVVAAPATRPGSLF